MICDDEKAVNSCDTQILFLARKQGSAMPHMEGMGDPVTLSSFRIGNRGSAVLQLGGDARPYTSKSTESVALAARELGALFVHGEGEGRDCDSHVSASSLN